MAKYVEVKRDNDDKVYRLEFDRASVQKAEAMGLDLQNMGKEPMTGLVILVKASLAKHHPGTSSATAEKFTDELIEAYGMPALMETMITLYDAVFPQEGTRAEGLKIMTTGTPELKAVK